MAAPLDLVGQNRPTIVSRRAPDALPHGRHIPVTAHPARRGYALAMPRPSSARMLACALVVGSIVAACGGSRIPVVSFDPSSACTTDGRQAGAYPALEALLPTRYEGKAPASVDSGRNCTTTALGTLAGAGITGVRFAGATWEMGGTTALTVAVFQADGLDATEMIGFYEAGASANSKTEKLSVTDLTVAGRPARRLDVLQSDGTGQTIVAWPASTAGDVNVLLAADLGDAKVLEALAQFGSR
jgi:hypothetical protein